MKPSSDHPYRCRLIPRVRRSRSKWRSSPLLAACALIAFLSQPLPAQGQSSDQGTSPPDPEPPAAGATPGIATTETETETEPETDAPPVAAAASARAPDNGTVNGTVPLLSDRNLRVSHFRIPAPRGLIVDRKGRALTANRAVSRLAIRLNALSAAADSSPLDELSAISAVKALLANLQTEFPKVEWLAVSDRDIAQHWQHRRWLPLPITHAYADQEALAAVELASQTALTELTEYIRDYPGGEAAAHVTGYITATKPDQHGPVVDNEFRWPEVAGRSGLEASLEELIAGQPGEVSEVYDHHGLVVNRELHKSPQPGTTVVTTLDLAMQNRAHLALQESGRAGAFVVMDARTGDLLVLASHPSFDPREIVSGISGDEFAAISDHPDQPFFFRPVAGAYPPGSTFKPFVALAALDRRVVNGLATQIAAPPELNIDGRDFHNWNDQHEGNLDVRFALLRSSNTWFYQVGIHTGGPAIYATAESFGFGKAPALPFPGVAAGTLPERNTLGIDQAVANFSIGQGKLTTSPVQLARAIAGLANGRRVPEARLILQHQDSLDSTVLHEVAQSHHSMLGFRPYDLQLTHAGMWGVVNHDRGTGKGAAADPATVYGKTGTAQWFSGGGERALAWFCGFLPTADSALAFVVFVEGEVGEKIFGGQNAAPVAGEFLRDLVASPATYGVQFSDQKLTATPVEPSTPPTDSSAPSISAPSTRGSDTGIEGLRESAISATTIVSDSAPPAAATVSSDGRVRVPAMTARNGTAVTELLSPPVDATVNSGSSTTDSSISNLQVDEVPGGVSLPRGAIPVREVRVPARPDAEAGLERASIFRQRLQP